MDDTDPFGRSKDEDPLGDMGWSAGGAEAPAAGPADLAPAETPDRAVERQEVAERAKPPGGFTRVPSGIPGPRRSRGGLGCLIAVVAFFALGLAGLVVIGAGVQEAGDTIKREVEEAVPEVPDVPAPDRPARPREGRPPTAFSEASLLRRGNLAPALRDLRRVTKSTRVRLIRIDAEGIVVQAAASGGRTKLATKNWNTDATLLSTSPGGEGSTTFRWSDVDPSAPNRIARFATRGRRPSSFDYLVMIDAAGLRWSAFLKNGRGTFTAAPDGSGISRTG